MELIESLVASNSELNSNDLDFLLQEGEYDSISMDILIRFFTALEQKDKSELDLLYSENRETLICTFTELCECSDTVLIFIMKISKEVEAIIINDAIFWYDLFLVVDNYLVHKEAREYYLKLVPELIEKKIVKIFSTLVNDCDMHINNLRPIADELVIPFVQGISKMSINDLVTYSPIFSGSEVLHVCLDRLNTNDKPTIDLLFGNAISFENADCIRALLPYIDSKTPAISLKNVILDSQNYEIFTLVYDYHSDFSSSDLLQALFEICNSTRYFEMNEDIVKIAQVLLRDPRCISSNADILRCWFRFCGCYHLNEYSEQLARLLLCDDRLETDGRELMALNPNLYPKLFLNET